MVRETDRSKRRDAVLRAIRATEDVDAVATFVVVVRVHAKLATERIRQRPRDPTIGFRYFSHGLFVPPHTVSRSLVLIVTSNRDTSEWLAVFDDTLLRHLPHRRRRCDVDDDVAHPQDPGIWQYNAHLESPVTNHLWMTAGEEGSGSPRASLAFEAVVT